MINLTQRENEIVSLVLDGLSNKEIGMRLNISIHTVKTNLEKIYEKTGVHNRVLLAVLMLKG